MIRRIKETCGKHSLYVAVLQGRVRKGSAGRAGQGWARLDRGPSQAAYYAYFVTQATALIQKTIQ